MTATLSLRRDPLRDWISATPDRRMSDVFLDQRRILSAFRRIPDQTDLPMNSGVEFMFRTQNFDHECTNTHVPSSSTFGIWHEYQQCSKLSNAVRKLGTYQIFLIVSRKKNFTEKRSARNSLSSSRLEVREGRILSFRNHAKSLSRSCHTDPRFFGPNRYFDCRTRVQPQTPTR